MTVDAKTQRRLPGAGWTGPRQTGKCRYCGGEAKPPRSTFCSGERARFAYRDPATIAQPGTGCVHEFLLRSDPGYARRHVYARDRGVCEICQAGSVPWDMDHRVPVAEGGGSCGLDNLRTLCRPCHKRETAALKGRLAQRRRQEAGP